MEKVKGKNVIENENLFRMLFCSPVAILFLVLAESYLMSPGIMLFKVIFVLFALYFTLSALAYAAFYTNDYYYAKADSNH